MTTEKTEMQFPYSPPDFFEAKYSRQTDEYILVADSGVVRITLCVPSDLIDAELQNRITNEVEGLFRVRQLLAHRPFKLNAASVYQHHSGGTRSISVSVEGGEFLSLVGQLDLVVCDASGAVKQDTKAERIKAQTEFINSVMPKLATSATLNAILKSYNAAVADPPNELVHLYEIRDALTDHYDKDDARRTLGISAKDWKRLGALANDAPLKEGRHRGKRSKLRHATPAELDEARKIAFRLIKAFANQL